MSDFSAQLVEHVSHNDAHADCPWCPEPHKQIEAAMAALHDNGVTAADYAVYLTGRRHNDLSSEVNG